MGFWEKNRDGLFLENEVFGFEGERKRLKRKKNIESKEKILGEKTR